MYPYGVRGLESEETFVIAIIGVVILVCILLIAVGFIQYIMQAIALNEIGKKRGVNNPWLAWIPVVGFAVWVLGSIVDSYEAEKGVKRKWRVVLVTTAIAMVSLMIIGYIMYIAGIVIMVAMSEYYYEASAAIPMALCVLGLIVLLVAYAASIAYAASMCICIFKLFESTVPEKALKYLLFSILVPLAYPICLLKCRNKGYSVPEQVQQTPAYEQVQAESERGEVENNNQENI